MIAVSVYSAIFVQIPFWIIASGAPGASEPKSWPPMKNYDIWETPNELDSRTGVGQQITRNFLNQTSHRQKKVLNFFPVPVDDECLADDGRRSGICLNVYECRLKGGTARGECALGFGVCCVFVASCDQEITNNITYIISPNFPSSMPSNFSSCKIKVKMISPDVSQIRIDFQHFYLGQPNRSTGVCDGDIFQVSGGLEGPLTLCGQNSGQHVYYDVGGRVTARQAAATGAQDDRNATTLSLSNSTVAGAAEASTASMASTPEMEDIEIFMNFTDRILPIRLWEIRIVQIPFSQRAPAGCMQFFTGTEGIIQTFNFADNGRHLANQDYRACIRQEHEMCSIAYEPCDEQSFRIGPTVLSAGEADGAGSNEEMSSAAPYAIIPSTSSPPPPTTEEVPSSSVSASTPQMETIEQSVQQSEEASLATTPTTNAPTPPTEATSVADDADTLEEGSGDGGGGDISPSSAATPPVRGGFDIFEFLRSTFFNFRRRRRRSGRQIFPVCTDRITMPCIVEDFIGAGLGTIPDCEPVHCGDKFCSSGSNLCRIESTVTPFYLGVHFGDGSGKGSPEENIGACLRYTQMPCM